MWSTLLAVMLATSGAEASTGVCLDVEAFMSLASQTTDSASLSQMLRSHPHGEALCMEMGWRCDEALERLGGARDSAEARPCLDEEVEGRCKDLDEPVTLESLTGEGPSAGRPDHGVPRASLALACYASRSQCSGLPAPEAPRQLRSPSPAPFEVTPVAHLAAPCGREITRPDHPGLAACQGAATRLERPPPA